MLTIVGPLPDIAPALFATALSVVLIGWALIKQRLLQVAPTMVWSALMLVPFVFVSGGFAPQTVWPQALGVAIVSLALLTGDAVGLRAVSSDTITDGAPRSALGNRSAGFGLIVLLSLMVVFLPIYHVLKAGNVPAFSFLFGGATEIDNALSREAFAKLLPAPAIVKYAFNWTLSVFGPLLIALLVQRRWFFLAGLAFAWLLAYSILSTARAPLVIFVMLTAIACSFALPRLLRALTSLAVVGGLSLLVGSSIFRVDQLVTHHNSIGISSEAYADYRSQAAAQDPIRSFTVADADRLRISKPEEPISGTYYYYLVYRIFLTPVDVSHRWYAHFGQVAAEWRPLGEIVGQRAVGRSHAANQVGTWAYVERFPDKYLDSVSAYGSLDADAYSFGGLPAVMLAAVCLVALRLGTILVQISQAGGIVVALVLGQLSIFPVSASLQAILVAQGLGILAAIGAWMYLAELLSGSRARPSETGRLEQV